MDVATRNRFTFHMHLILCNIVFFGAVTHANGLLEDMVWLAINCLTTTISHRGLQFRYPLFNVWDGSQLQLDVFLLTARALATYRSARKNGQLTLQAPVFFPRQVW